MKQSDFTVIYLCNAVDELTKKERNIPFASQAEANKVFEVVRALQTQNIEVNVLSLGRGKQRGDGHKFPSFRKIVSEIQIYYAAFWHLPFLTHIVGAISLMILSQKITRNSKNQVIIIAYNRQLHYIPTLVLAKFQKIKCVLDLEDGTIDKTRISSRIFGEISKMVYNFLCHDGALLATRALKDQVKTKRTHVCYGCTEFISDPSGKWGTEPLEIIFCGTLLHETGARLLLDTISLLDNNFADLKGRMVFNITGQGSMSGQIARFANDVGKEWIRYYGNIDRISYIDLLDHSQVGLSLRLPSSELGKTTFPSKIIEYASYGLLIISTRVSDVPDLLDDESAILLNDESPEGLVKKLINLINHQIDGEFMARLGQEKINSICNYETVGKGLKTSW